MTDFLTVWIMNTGAMLIGYILAKNEKRMWKFVASLFAGDQPTEWEREPPQTPDYSFKEKR